MKRLDLIIIAVVLALACTALFMARLSASSGGKEGMQVEIYYRNVLIERLDLNQDQTFDIERDGIYNRILIQDGAVYVAEASCPDQVCVHTGAQSLSGSRIACLPNRLVVRLVAVSGDSADPEGEDHVDIVTN